jgi:MYXO-CTERM domain-containing protein
MRKIFCSCAALVALQAVAMAQPGPAINGLKLTPRVFNDFSTTTLVTTNGNSVNQGALSTVTINESLWADDGMGGTFANRHDVHLSPDAGASNQLFSIDDEYTVSALVTLAPVSSSPRKEAGFHLDSQVTGTASFIINSDAGEIVAFGGGAPFKSFGNNSGGNGYVPGSTILMGMIMRPAGDGNGPLKSTIEYFIDRDGPGAAFGIELSGPLVYNNLEGGPVNYSISLYTQSRPNLSNPAEAISTTFSDIRYSPLAAVPEPTTAALGLAALMGLVAIRRR